jgi:mevalonate kinase
MKAIAPGKLILSGEHAVVHGSPALALAINRYATAHVTPRLSPLISFDILDLHYHKAHAQSTLRRIKKRLWHDYQSFLSGEYSIRDVLKKPFELSQFVLTHFLDKLNLTLTQGFNLRTHSTIPIGCGMGSSAAMILSVLYAIAQHLKLDLSADNYLSIGQEAENLQHGQSSGLDLQVSFAGGCVRYENGSIESRPLPKLPMYLVNTGQPSSNTGECVNKVAPHFAHNSLIRDFSATTNQLDQALLRNDRVAFQAAIRENHRLLIRIGVVPEKIQCFITEIEQSGAAAKICGAGSIRGHNAGIVLILSEQSPEILCQKYGYACHPVQGETRGLRTI